MYRCHFQLNHALCWPLSAGWWEPARFVCTHVSAHVSVRMGAEFHRARYGEPGGATEMTCRCVDTINNKWPFSLIKEQGGEP